MIAQHIASVIGMMDVVQTWECGGKATETRGCLYFKGVSWAEWVGQGHVAVENIREHWRMLGKKFYITKQHFCSQI